MINTQDPSESYLSVLVYSENVVYGTRSAPSWMLILKKQEPKQKNLLGKCCYGRGKTLQSEAVYGLYMFCTPPLVQFYPTTYPLLIPSTLYY